MAIDKNKSLSAAELRRQAEAHMKSKIVEEHPARKKGELQRLGHELEVHRIELEMQNDELRQARDKVEAALEQCTELYDFAPVGYLTIDRGGTIRNLNLTGAALLGGERSRLIGQRISQFVHVTDRTAFTVFLNTVFTSQEMKTGEVALLNKGKQQHIVHVEAAGTSSGQDCRVALIDITERKLTDDKLRKSEQLYAEAQRLVHLGSWQWDAIANTVTGSDEFYRIFGLSFSTYEDFMKSVHPEDRERVNTAFQDTLKRHMPYDIYYRIVHPDGTIRIIHARGRGIADDAGKVIQMNGTAHDVTERRHIEDELQKAHDELELRVTERTAELRDAFEEIKLMKDRLKAENIYLQQEVARVHNFGEIIGQSSAISYVFFRVEQVAAMDATVLLLGETGTGKGVFARAIHSRSARKDRPMVTVNCSSLPANLIESELFGREKGAFTGADARQMGRFELADGGTIFLDEIGEMPLELQPKLLRVIQDGEFERLGSPRTIKVNVRIIAASNRKLEVEIKNGRFREDLFYRLNVFPITIPPLRQRKDDIPLLAKYFVAKFNKKIGKRIESVSKDTLASLEEYHWPGNVRELESVIERAVIMSRGTELNVLDRFDTFRKPEEPSEQEKELAELEYDHILRILQKTNWRIEGKNGAALLLGLNASTLRARMRKCGISRK